MESERGYLLRKLPAVGEMLRHEQLQGLLAEVPRPVILQAVRQVLGNYRSRLLREEAGPVENEQLIAEIATQARRNNKPRLQRVINCTGVVLHTNLGRAPLCRSAIEMVGQVSFGYANLELDLSTGERGSRYDHVAEMISSLTGAESSLVVNNNAAAVLLALSALARDREVIVSRGQLVEIGGSFRVPEVMVQSGARLVEVGTTNKTYLRDYEAAVTEATALLLKVHTSNYRIEGFTHETTGTELVNLGRSKGLPVMEDLGSGFLLDLTSLGITGEPTVRSCVAQGIDIVTFSGDKLLGGPQAGIIVGRQELISRLKSHPLNRALRVDKLTIAALEATLREYLEPERACREIPALEMLTLPLDELERRAEALRSLMAAALGSRAQVAVRKGYSEAGGGALPGTRLPTSLVTIDPGEVSCQEASSRLRQGEPPVLVRVQEEKVVIDVRTVFPLEFTSLVEAMGRCLAPLSC